MDYDVTILRIEKIEKPIKQPNESNHDFRIRILLGILL